MPIPALLVAGLATQVVGTFVSNMQQSQAEIENAQFYYKQAQFAQLAADRERRLAGRHYAALAGKQAGAYASGNVSVGAGSSLAVLAMTEASRLEELSAIESKRDLEVSLARGRGRQSESTGRLLADPGYNLLQAGGTVLTGLAASGNIPGGSSVSYGGQGPMSSSFSPTFFQQPMQTSMLGRIGG